MPEVYRIPYADPRRMDNPTDAVRQALWQLFEEVDVTRIAAVIVEPILGEGGVVVPPDDFLFTLRTLCDIENLLLIVDEVQTGMGRTGRMWAVEHSGVVPDLMVVGKSLAAGMPLSAVVGHAEIMDTIEEGGIGGTYVGNPVSCAAALAVFEVFEQEQLLQRAAALEHVWSARRARLYTYPEIYDVRGRGAIFGIDFARPVPFDPYAPGKAARLAARLAQRGVLMLPAGRHHTVLRALPPLNIQHELLEDALDILEQEVREA
jgi:4-aminobutyrate aminotransferase-like enzyme